MKSRYDNCVVKVSGGWLWRGGAHSGITKTRRDARFLQEIHTTGIHQPATPEPPPMRTPAVEAGIAGLRQVLQVKRDATAE